ncbi:adhesin transport system outer membrane protein [Paraburkholderia caballeronis]|nr:adhesin transport system outer membrane protein [Paraburkholderia caballeronis]TDV14883.1 adhesin transport system outer membrane protein [Paraburkholderia caballeronis]TDV24003.1 adhesin transport system outer membrane protein [Paraburkholderia caballeronis]
MRYGTWQWSFIVLLAAMPAAVTAEEAPDSSKKAGQQMVCNPDCNWVTAEAPPPPPPPPDPPVVEADARRPRPTAICNPDCTWNGDGAPPAAQASAPATPAAVAQTGVQPDVGAPTPSASQAEPVRNRSAAPVLATRSSEKQAYAPNQAAMLENEAAAAGVRRVLDVSRKKQLQQNLAREGLQTPEARQASGPRYDLWQVVDMAVANYPSIRNAMAAVGQQQASVDVARAGYYPTVQVGINTGHQGVYGNGQAATASVSQMLYDFGKVKNAVLSAESSVRTRQLQVRAEVDNIARQAALTAIELERFKALEASARSQLNAVSKLLDLARKRAEEGASTRADPVQAEARVSAAEATLQAMITQVNQQRTKLATLIGRNVPEGGIDIPPGALQQAVAGIRPDVENAVNVQLAEAEKETAIADLAQAKSNTKPTLSVQAGVNQYLGGASNYTPGGRVYTLTLGVSHNLFEGGAPSARVRGASEALRGADERIRTEQLQADDDRRVFGEQMTSLASRMQTLGSRQKSIVETQKLYREQYLSLGTRSLLDLLNSEAEIFQAESDEINARHDMWAAEVSYINATGYMHDVFKLVNES